MQHEISGTRAGSEQYAEYGPAVPLNVWPVGQTAPSRQWAGRHRRENREYRKGMAPELARRIVAEFSRPGDLVVDPLAGTGTALAEAAGLGRRGVGVEREPRWVQLTQANLDHALPEDRRHLAEVRAGDASELPRSLGDLAGQVDLVITAPPYAENARIVDQRGGQSGGDRGGRSPWSPSPGRANLACATDGSEAAMADVYAACHPVLRPGGLLVTVTKNLHSRGRLVDLAGATVWLARTAGLFYFEHVIAVHAVIRDSALVARPWQRPRSPRHLRGAGRPLHPVVHEDVCVFIKPGTAECEAKERTARA